MQIQIEIKLEKIFFKDFFCNNFLQKVLKNSYYNRYIIVKFI